MVALAAHSAPARALAHVGMVLAILVVIVSSPPARAAGPDVRVTSDVPYGSDVGTELTLDVYQPGAGTSPGPVVILIHGGGWTSGDKQRYEPFSRSLAEQGFVVFGINYSLDLSGSPGFPRQVDDVHAALAWVQENATRYGGDANRVAVAGGSAGGYLAAMLGTQANSSVTAPIRAVISLSGPMDLVALVDDLRTTVTSSDGQCAPLSCDALHQATSSLRNLLGCEPLQCSEQLLRQASPVTYVTPTSPPFLLANSTQEIVPATQASAMASALRAKGVAVDVQLVPGDRHSVAYVPAISSSVLTFLREHDGGIPGSPAALDSTVDQDDQAYRPAWLLRWLVVAAAVGALAVIVTSRRRMSARPADDRGDPLREPTASGRRS